MPKRRCLYSSPSNRDQLENIHMVAVCQPLGAHLMRSEISPTVVAERLGGHVNSQGNHTSEESNSHQVLNSNKRNRSFATDCQKWCIEATSAMENDAISVHSKAHRLPRKRKYVVGHRNQNREAEFCSSMFGGDILHELCSIPVLPQVLFNLENYREQLRNILEHLDRNDLLLYLHRSKPVVKDLVEEHYMRQSFMVQESSTRVLRSSVQAPSMVRQSERLGAQSHAPVPVTCVVRMRVCMQYKSHELALAAVESDKNTEKARQLDKFMQAKHIMRARELGCIVCNICFSDITYLGAFWRDYVNGALQDSIREVFLTERMLETAGNEQLDLLVSVDENDFLKGQKLLVKTLQQDHSGSSPKAVRVRIEH